MNHGEKMHYTYLEGAIDWNQVILKGYKSAGLAAKMFETWHKMASLIKVVWILPRLLLMIL